MGDRPPWLTQSEVDDMCHPLVQKAAQRRYLKRLGLEVKEKPDGSPLVLRSNVEATCGPKALKPKKSAKPEPDAASLRLVFSHR